MSRVRLFGFDLDALRMSEAVAQLIAWARTSDGKCHYVVTPNVDHTIMYRENPQLRAAYADASLVLADGAPVLIAARLLGKKIPERVPGSDLAPALFKEVSRRMAGRNDLSSSADDKPLRIFLLGAAPGVADRAAQKITSQWPAVSCVGTYSPPLGFEREPAENARILERIAAAKPDVLIVGLGAPKQELWVHAHRNEIAAPVALCIGATIDFLAGVKPRAPRWMRRLGLEWCHRLATEPRRLAKRYFRDAVLFPQLVWREWRSAT